MLYFVIIIIIIIQKFYIKWYAWLKKKRCNDIKFTLQCGVWRFPNKKILQLKEKHKKKGVISPLIDVNHFLFDAKGCRYGEDLYNQSDWVQLGDTSNILSTKENHNTVEICVENDVNNNEYYLYFVQNNVVVNENITGKIKLDMKNYECYFDLESVCCVCPKSAQCEGIEYEVVISTTKI